MSGSPGRISEGSANPGGIDYRYIIKSLIPIGFALFFVQSLSRGDQELSSRSGGALMSPIELLAIGMLVSFFVLLLAGIPVALTLAMSGFVFGLLGFGPLLFNLLPHRIFGVVTNSTLLAIPLFVFMGMMLESSRLAEELMDVIGLPRARCAAASASASSWSAC